MPSRASSVEWGDECHGLCRRRCILLTTHHQALLCSQDSLVRQVLWIWKTTGALGCLEAQLQALLLWYPKGHVGRPCRNQKLLGTSSIWLEGKSKCWVKKLNDGDSLCSWYQLCQLHDQPFFTDRQKGENNAKEINICGNITSGFQKAPKYLMNDSTCLRRDVHTGNKWQGCYPLLQEFSLESPGHSFPWWEHIQGVQWAWEHGKENLLMLTRCFHSDKLSAWPQEHSVRTHRHLQPCQAQILLLWLKKKLVVLTYKKGR